MSAVPHLPIELWELIICHGRLCFAPYLRLSSRELAARKIQRAARVASLFRVRGPWNEGMHVRVYRPNVRKWLFGRIACLKFDNMSPPENWAVVVMFNVPGPKLLIFLQANRHPPLRRVDANITEPVLMTGRVNIPN